jgi:hypothetical protein
LRIAPTAWSFSRFSRSLTCCAPMLDSWPSRRSSTSPLSRRNPDFLAIRERGKRRGKVFWVLRGFRAGGERRIYRRTGSVSRRSGVPHFKDRVMPSITSAAITSPNCLVVAEPPMSGVRTCCLARTAEIAFSMASAAAGWSRWRSIMAPDQI